MSWFKTIFCVRVSPGRFRDIPLQIEIGFLRFVERDLSCIQLNKNWGKLKKCLGIVKGCLKKKYSMAIIQYTKISYYRIDHELDNSSFNWTIDKPCRWHSFFYWIQITTKYFNLFILSYHKTNIRKGVILVYNSQGANRNRKDLLFENWFKW